MWGNKLLWLRALSSRIFQSASHYSASSASSKKTYLLIRKFSLFTVQIRFFGVTSLDLTAYMLGSPQNRQNRQSYHHRSVRCYQLCYPSSAFLFKRKLIQDVFSVSWTQSENSQVFYTWIYPPRVSTCQIVIESLCYRNRTILVSAVGT